MGTRHPFPFAAGSRSPAARGLLSAVRSRTTGTEIREPYFLVPSFWQGTPTAGRQNASIPPCFPSSSGFFSHSSLKETGSQHRKRFATAKIDLACGYISIPQKRLIRALDVGFFIHRLMKLLCKDKKRKRNTKLCKGIVIRLKETGAMNQQGIGRSIGFFTCCSDFLQPTGGVEKYRMGP